MATIPDTPDIANALNRSDPAQAAARERLLILHTLGTTEAGVAAAMRQRIADLEAERDARPTQEAFDELEAERDALLAELGPYRNPPPGPFAVPVVQFRAGLLPMRLRLLGADSETRLKWGVILPELDILTVVYPREQPVAGLLGLAVADGLLTQAEADALKGL